LDCFRGGVPDFTPIPRHDKQKPLQLGCLCTITRVSLGLSKIHREVHMSLTQKQIKFLKGLAHHLDPVVSIGKNGMTDAIVRELDMTLKAHELIKVRILSEDRTERQELLQSAADSSGAQLVQIIGKLGVLYRPDAEDPEIKLP
jgi:RNA-binding protein